MGSVSSKQLHPSDAPNQLGLVFPDTQHLVHQDPKVSRLLRWLE
jgi:hypothetical protein